MSVSVFDLFKIGIGPSSSHTVGPMKAARMFVSELEESRLLDHVARIEANLYGSLAATGKGHGSDKAVLLGLSGHAPETVDPDAVDDIILRITQTGTLEAAGRSIRFDSEADLRFRKRDKLPGHPNGMRFIAFDADAGVLLEKQYFSVGGGFVVDNSDEQMLRVLPAVNEVEFPFRTGVELLDLCERNNLTISQIMMRNERFWRSDEETTSGLQLIWDAMQDCIERGYQGRGVLPGRLQVNRRAADLYEKLSARAESSLSDPLAVMDWVNLYALAVNEENAAGGRVVTAPTNGAAGVIPAVGRYYLRFIGGASNPGIHDFLLTAAAIGLLYKENASLSGAEVGCQGEVGVACSMAAGALTAVLGGTPTQIENAAEIGMEHNLGLTCDPVGGLVQIPCIERNAMGAMKAINASRLALRGDGKHYVSLDRVIRTMHQTGRDMKTKYKETSRGGLAVNVIEC